VPFRTAGLRRAPSARGRLFRTPRHTGRHSRQSQIDAVVLGQVLWLLRWGPLRKIRRRTDDAIRMSGPIRTAIMSSPLARRIARRRRNAGNDVDQAVSTVISTWMSGSPAGTSSRAGERIALTACSPAECGSCRRAFPEARLEIPARPRSPRSGSPRSGADVHPPRSARRSVSCESAIEVRVGLEPSNGMAHADCEPELCGRLGELRSRATARKARRSLTFWRGIHESIS